MLLAQMSDSASHLAAKSVHLESEIVLLVLKTQENEDFKKKMQKWRRFANCLGFRPITTFYTVP